MFKKTVLLFFVIITLFACKDEQYQLKWKIPAGEVLIYNIKMETIDSLSSVSEENLQELIELVAKMYGDSVDVPVATDDLYKGLIRQLNLLSYFSIVRQGGGDKIKIDFITRQTRQYEQIKYLDIFNKFIRKAFFKGTISSDGTLLNYGGEAIHDPKINILFELPDKPVAIGESWSLNVEPEWQLTEKEQIDSAINKVTLSDIVMDGPDSVAVLKYQLQSPDKSGRTLSFTGEGRFNINLGKWTSYTGVLSQKTLGFLPMTQVQKIKLSEISVEKYKAILKHAQKADIFDTGNDFKTEKDSISDTNDDGDNPNEEPDKPVANIDCPVVYRVQVLATQKPVKDVAAEFKSVKYQVDEIILSEQEKFKYKYTIGKECSMAGAKMILSEIQKSGYPKAYIIKTPPDL